MNRQVPAGAGAFIGVLRMVSFNAFSFPTRTMTPAEVAKLGLTGIEGGEQGLVLAGPDGKAYGFLLRPLLPDETS